MFILIATRPSDEPEERKERAWSIDVIDVMPASISPTLELFGQVQSPQDSELSAGIEAVVVEMPVRDGNYAAKGEVLLVLDDRNANLALRQNEADLKEARAQMKFARIRLIRSKEAFAKEQELLVINQSRDARAKELSGEGLLSMSDRDTASENLARQQIAVNQAELNVEENSAKLVELDARIARITASLGAAAIDLDRTRVKAPFSGIISDLQVSEGDRVRIGDPLMRLQNPDSIEIRAQLPSRIARSISGGLSQGIDIRAIVEVDNMKLEGKLLRVSGQTSSGSGGVDSFIGVAAGVTGLRLGSTVRLMLELPAEKNVIAVPGEAIYGSNRLYKLADDRMQMIEFERVGERAYGSGRTQVLARTSQLVVGDKVIVTKLANAADGLLVKATTSINADESNTALSKNTPEVDLK
ncbi:MAG: biotin/lipoyl-binding protein [Gammaproteobacteria bacterium]|nr:biotin/lipoyl-binding protein [Gammaproteobacteria bacterium]